MWHTDWITTIPKKFSHCCKSSESNIRLPSLGIRQRDWNPQGIWCWGPVGFDYRIYRGLGKQETPVWKGINKILHTPRPRGEKPWPTGDWTETTSQCWRASCGAMGRQRLTTRTGALEGLPWHKPFWSSSLTQPQSPQTPKFGYLRPNNYQGGNATLPISR